MLDILSSDQLSKPFISFLLSQFTALLLIGVGGGSDPGVQRYTER